LSYRNGIVEGGILLFDHHCFVILVVLGRRVVGSGKNQKHFVIYFLEENKC